VVHQLRILQPGQMKKKPSSNMANAESSADSLKFSGKLKEMLALAAFVLVIAIISVVSMDLLLIPLIALAKNEPALFTDIFVIAILCCTAVFIIYRLAMTVLYWIKNGFTVREITASLFSGRLRAFLFFLVAVATVTLCILAIYNLFQFNTSLITDMAG